jgi:hydroxyethylthiazole kinase-like uncharacterized protein yjeF
MKLANSAQMRELDRITMEEYKTPGIILMENAGLRVADQIQLRYKTGKILVVCGKGNNGGDGSVAARHLYTSGRDVALTYISGTDALKGDAKTAFEAAYNMGVPIMEWDVDLPEKYDIITDAIFGIGISGAPNKEYSDAINAINKAEKTVVSVDVPSGGNADNGHIPGKCIKADLTVTFGVGKAGLVCYPLRYMAGEVVIKPISFAPINMDTRMETLDEVEIPKISPLAHKGSQGKLFVISGSRGMTGAATLNCQGALHTGCGIVTLGIAESLNSIMEEKLTEAMTIPLPEDNGNLSATAAEYIVKESVKYNALLCGSGLSKSDEAKAVVNEIICNTDRPLVLDADALNIISEKTDILNKKKNEIIVTPHIGEMARLLDKTTEETAMDTIASAREFSLKYKVVTVLKSAHTVISSPEGEIFINTFGNGGMATAGSGDVLAGIIGSFLAQGFDALTAAKYGVVAHAKAGDKAAQRYGKRYITATDIIENLKEW